MRDKAQVPATTPPSPLTLKIETLMRDKAQVPITTPLFPTYDKCGIVHKPGECTIDDKLATTMDEINFVGGENNSYNQYPNNFNLGQGFRKDQEER